MLTLERASFAWEGSIAASGEGSSLRHVGIHAHLRLVHYSGLVTSSVARRPYQRKSCTTLRIPNVRRWKPSQNGATQLVCGTSRRLARTTNRVLLRDWDVDGRDKSRPHDGFRACKNSSIPPTRRGDRGGLHHSTFNTTTPKPALPSMVLNSARLPLTISSNSAATSSISPAISTKAACS